MRNILFILFPVLLLGFTNASAQRTEFGIWAGGSTYFGDLNANTSFRLTKPAAGAYGRINFNSRLSVKVMAAYAEVAGNDAYSGNYYQIHRNLSFSSPILEASGQLEFNFLDYSSTNPKYKFSPYFLLGFGLFSFDPSTVYDGSTYRLQPIGTEGQGYPEYPDLKKYSLTNAFVSIGGGFKFRLSKNFSFFLEGAVRKTFTHYLDDVGGVYPSEIVLLNEGGPLAANLSDRSSQIGGLAVGQEGKYRSNNKADNYFLFGIGLSFTINNYKCPFAIPGNEE